MDKKNPNLTALLFNECINNQDLDGLCSLMTEGHTFIVKDEKSRIGKEKMRKDWGDFFRLFPDYKNHFPRIESRDDLVIIVGFSICSNESLLNGPALWTAKIENDRIAEWRVYNDTGDNRKSLKITA
ncbi:MAG: nuclear transport factor 2 family protein [bacterium]